jgi:hypothetical protein
VNESAVRRRAAAAASALAGVLLIAGCVNLPTEGQANNSGHLPDSAAGTAQQVQLVPLPPGTGWQPGQIVRGFLAATGATWTGQPSSLGVARQYLTASFAKKWHPTPAATVIDTSPQVVPTSISPKVTGGQAVAQVAVTSQHLESLVAANAREAGSIAVSSLHKPYVFDFDLVQVDAKWRIASVTGPGSVDDDTLLLLENSDFLRDYQPRNLYFPAVSSPGTLVPFPVYIPDQSGSLGVKPLVEGLTSPPPPGSNWLYRSVMTAFPADTTVRAQVQPHNNSVTVDLGGKASRAGPARLTQMEAQLFWTLTSSPYSGGSGIQSVVLQIGIKSYTLLPSKFASWVPSQQPGALYFQAIGAQDVPQFEMTSADGATPSRKKGSVGYPTQIQPAKLGTGSLTAVAVSPPSRANPQAAPLFAGCRGKWIYVAQLGPGSQVTSEQISANCTSLSWDDNGYLWVTAPSDVFRVSVTASGLQVVTIAIAAPLLPTDTFTSVKVAPDGVRVAMIIAHGRRSASVVVTSVSQKSSSLIYLAQNQHFLTVGPELADPVALCWWGPDHLLVLDRQDNGTELYEVPLNGGVSTPLPNSPPNAISVTGDGVNLAVDTEGASGPVVKVSRDLGAIWRRIAGASTPAYPG